MFVFVIFNSFTLDIVDVFFEEELCIERFKFYSSVSDAYDWRALNLSYFLKRCIDSENN